MDFVGGVKESKEWLTNEDVLRRDGEKTRAELVKGF